MMNKKYDTAVFIGRMSPPHAGHIHVINEGLKQAETVTILIGSANAARSHRNPFTFAERKKMISGSIAQKDRDRVIILPLEDTVYNDTLWVKNVQNLVDTALEKIVDPSVALIGHNKDSTSYYMCMFPQWSSIEVPNHRNLNSTQIRNAYFSNIGQMWVNDADGHKDGDLVQDKIVSTATRDFLDKFLKTAAYKNICEEYEFVKKYKLAWATAPYDPIFVTVDAVVIQSGHILLVRRKAAPGKGLWALPGGFLNKYEFILDAMIRELREETAIKVPEPVLRGSIVARDVFDDPNRSARGRTITHAFLIKLANDIRLPKVKGSDDADKAKWVPINKLKREDFFDDHFDVIFNMVGRI